VFEVVIIFALIFERKVDVSSPKFDNNSHGWLGLLSFLSVNNTCCLKCEMKENKGNPTKTCRDRSLTRLVGSSEGEKVMNFTAVFVLVVLCSTQV